MSDHIERDPVIVDSGRLDASIFPSNFSFALKDSLVNQGGDIVKVADKSNQAGEDAENAVNTNIRQDEEIQKNQSDIEENRLNIEENTQSIKENTMAIVENKEAIDNHVSSNSAHGADGDIIGNLNFCQIDIGGVVLLAGAVNPIEASFPDLIAGASSEYNQGQMQLVINAVNTLSKNQTQIVESFNSLITALKNAKHMEI